MKLESDGILISLAPIGNRDSVARVFTRDFGVMRGVMRGAAAGNNRRPPLVGQIGMASWNARLDSQLGAFHWESTRNIAAPLLANPTALGFMNAAFDLIAEFLPEREPYINMYDETLNLLQQLVMGNDTLDNIYLGWEMAMLRELGYALDLSRCSGCGARENLNYLSPRTGRAVCDACAAPYINRLFKLPITLNTTLQFLDAAGTMMGGTIPRSRHWINRINKK